MVRTRLSDIRHLPSKGEDEMSNIKLAGEGEGRGARGEGRGARGEG
jgi:hypothetical protein